MPCTPQPVWPIIMISFTPNSYTATNSDRMVESNGLVQELRHFVLREMGFRSFVHHRLREAKRFLCFIGRQLVRLLKEVWPDLVFLAVFLGVLWKVCWPGILNNWGFGASDLPVHNYWINGLIDNKLYIAGIYPMGMHCMLYYLSTVLVCLSGGADSVALLDVLLRAGYACVAAHCNFHLRGEESMRDEAFVRTLCDSQGVRLLVQDF